MDADFSIELGREDPALDFPWSDPAGKLAYVNLKGHPELIGSTEETIAFPELAEFLRVLNSMQSMMETAKCDVWMMMELSAEEEIYDASNKVASYVDLVFSDADTPPSSSRLSLPAHEQFARKLVELLRRTPEIPVAVEVCVRRCHFAHDEGAREGFYCTLYVSGYGKDEAGARRHWGVGLQLVGNAILQLSAAGT
jgi:hypothetical protein